MLILTIRTDQPEAEIGLFENDKELAYETWPAHRQLAETIHAKIETLLSASRTDPDAGDSEAKSEGWGEVDGIVCFQGPGSFTGLRIGLTVGNSLSYGLGVPIVATGGKNWIQAGLKKLLAGENDQLALPEYGAPVHITRPRK